MDKFLSIGKKKIKAIQSYMEKHKKQVGILFGIVLLFLVVLVFTVPKMHARIQHKQMSSIIGSDYATNKTVLMTQEEINKIVAEKKPVTILLLDTKQSTFDGIQKIFSEKKEVNRLNTKLYILPILYDRAALEKKFNIKNQSVAIYYENGVERSRYIIENSDSVQNLKLTFIDSLNALSVANNSSEESQAESTTSTSDTQNDTIDTSSELSTEQ